jgi:hypothetical protein
MQTCINPECETIHMSDNLIICTECGHPFNDYGLSPPDDYNPIIHK